jgi:plastocyanin domain-containing protein
MNDYMKAFVIFVAVSLVLGVVIVSATNIITGRNILASDSISLNANSNNLAGTNNNGAITTTATTAAATASTSTTATDPTGVQTATMKVVNGNYVLSQSVFKKGIPVRITADIANMPGCSKSFTIPDFNIRKSLSANDNIIEFTPDKSGTFRMACTMNMYTGTFTVTDDGLAPTGAAAVQQAQVASAVASKPSGGSCGATGGGCGCGG